MRKFVLRTLLLSLLLCSLFSLTAYAESAEVTGSDVNLRSGPGINYEVIDSLAKGTVVTVNDRSNAEWYGVTCDFGTGFISSTYLSIREEEAQDVVTIDGTEHGAINAMYVRFRSGPSSESSILGEYNTGTELTITGTSGSWLAVTINGQDDYVYEGYVTRGEAPAATPEPEAEETPAAQETPAATPEVSVLAEIRTGTVNGDYVCLRSGPSTGYTIIDTYDRGKALTITGLSGDWTAVTIDGQAGFIYSQYVQEDPQSEAPAVLDDPAEEAPVEEELPPLTEQEPTDGYIRGNNVRLREKASMNAEVLAEYNSGKALTITGLSGDWTAVTIDGQAGFIYSQYVAEGTISVPTGDADLGSQIAAYALQYVGYPYVWAGKSPDIGFDCSGLVYYVYGQFGYTLARVANDQASEGIWVPNDQLQPGDILCFSSGGSYVGHVGIYIGDGKFVHASTSTTGVIISELSGWYETRGYSARRIV